MIEKSSTSSSDENVQSDSLIDCNATVKTGAISMGRFAIGPCKVKQTGRCELERLSQMDPSTIGSGTCALLGFTNEDGYFQNIEL
jgi:hypothetical protein